MAIRKPLIGNLKKCPFCGRVPKIVPCDDEGNLHLEAGYEENPWSGLGYQIMHEALTEDAAEDCPIASFKGETIGTIIYDTREEAAEKWNKTLTQETSQEMHSELMCKAFALACRLLGGDQWKTVREDLLETVESEPVCRVCGCTQNNACVGGCHWVKDDLCSKCATAPPAPEVTRNAT